MTQLKLAIIVVSWNNQADVLRCLEAVYANPGTFQVIVVDNASQDSTVQAIRAYYPQVVILANTENLGYTGGNNVGISYALAHSADAVLLLNDDAVLAEDALAQLLEVAALRTDAGFLGPSIYALEDKNRFMSAGGVFTNGWRAVHRGLGEDGARYQEAVEVDFLSGCALLARRAVVEQIGLLDDRFFAYHEDVDWCYRAKQAGFKLLVVPRARVWHPDTRARDIDSPVVTYYMTRNHLLFLSKHNMGKRLLMQTLFAYLVRVANWSLRPKWRHKRLQRSALVYAVADYASGRFGRAGRPL